MSSKVLCFRSVVAQLAASRRQVRLVMESGHGAKTVRRSNRSVGISPPLDPLPVWGGDGKCFFRQVRLVMESGHGVSTVRRSNRSVGTSPPLDPLPVWGGDGRCFLRQVRLVMEFGHGAKTVRRSNRSVGTSPPLDPLPGWGGDGRSLLRCVVAQFAAPGVRARSTIASGHGVTVRRSNRSVGTSPPLDCLPVWGGDGGFVLRSAVNERRSVLGAFCDVKLAAFTVGPWSFAVSFSMLGKGQRCISRSAVHGHLSDDVVTGSPLCAIAKRLKTAPVPPRLGRGREVSSFVASLRNWRRQSFEPYHVVESFTAIRPWAEVAFLPP